MTKEDRFCRFIGMIGNVTIEDVTELGRGPYRGRELGWTRETHAYVVYV